MLVIRDLADASTLRALLLAAAKHTHESARTVYAISDGQLYKPFPRLVQTYIPDDMGGPRRVIRTLTGGVGQRLYAALKHNARRADVFRYVDLYLGGIYLDTKTALVRPLLGDSGHDLGGIHKGYLPDKRRCPALWVGPRPPCADTGPQTSFSPPLMRSEITSSRASWWGERATPSSWRRCSTASVPRWLTNNRLPSSIWPSVRSGALQGHSQRPQHGTFPRCPDDTAARLAPLLWPWTYLPAPGTP